MKFITIIICLLLERYLHLNAKLGRYNPLLNIVARLQQTVTELRKVWVAYALLILVPTLLMSVAVQLLRYELSGLLNFLLADLIVLYCFSTAPKISMPHTALAMHDKPTAYLFWHKLIQLFAPIFWFAILGVFGVAAAFAYRLISQAHAASQHQTNTFSVIAVRVHGWALWLPARLLGLAIAIFSADTHHALVAWVKQVWPRNGFAKSYDALHDSFEFVCARIEAVAPEDIGLAIPLKLFKQSLVAFVLVIAVCNFLSLVV